MYYRKLLCLLFFSGLVFSQKNDKLILHLNDSGDRYIKISLKTQFWMRYMEMNPGSLIGSSPINEGVDFSVRRIRATIKAKLTKKLYVFSILGLNNIMISNGKIRSLDLLDMTVEYAFSKPFVLGFGKGAWYGLGRHTKRSSSSMMALDAPLFSLFLLNRTDDFGRSLRMWTKGQVGKIDYLFVLADPLRYKKNISVGEINFSDDSKNFNYSGYAKWEILDDESNETAYSAGTYLGRKKILNVGMGFAYQNDMTYTKITELKKKYYDFKSWSVDIFYDTPINSKGDAITTYFGYYDTNFGKNYIRSIGVENYTTEGVSLNGSGNATPFIGSGNTTFFQFGYFLGGFIQPNIAVQYSNFEKLKNPMVVYDIGCNLYFQGQFSKLSLGYQNRPVFDRTSLTEITRKGTLILQYQFIIN